VVADRVAEEGVWVQAVLGGRLWARVGVVAAEAVGVGRVEVEDTVPEAGAGRAVVGRKDRVGGMEEGRSPAEGMMGLRRDLRTGLHSACSGAHS
jgi:hypothetical protein